jgi:predicted  nucleic acid-binding Zn-ribbon protein
MKATRDQQQQLLTLADTDEELRRLDHKRANLPEQKVLDEHVELRQTITGDLGEATQTQERLQAQATRHEREIETADAGRKHSENLIYSGRITEERQLEALREEIAEKHRRKNDIEDSLLEIMEQLEEVTALVEELTSRRQELADQITHLGQRRDEAAADIDAEIAQLQQRRAAEAEGLDAAVLAAYDAVAAKRPGRAVARLEGRTCTGCHMELTAIELEEIKEAARESLAYCQQCGSIVVPSP